MSNISGVWFRRAAVTAAVCTIGTFAFADGTGNERRTTAECNALSATKPQEVPWCLECIAKNTEKAKFHYHPDSPAGERCRPANGKP